MKEKAKLIECKECASWDQLQEHEFMGQCKNRELVKMIWVEPYMRTRYYTTSFNFGCKFFKER
jgi:hypothetical protein